ncbi:PREDICTED: uncharacterized protein LOC109359323 [Lupinus angustifolius]|uniref:uncharacterized protein LOC109359323 n=1 Tax=Lupinus angustifolius TaxID=3871 RepID=UPI00092F4582|nr:PREDICTED: uncharacterized protein LOC109359323 [Lupinus angustifolius]
MTAGETTRRHSLSSLFSHDVVLPQTTTSLSDIIKQDQDNANNVKDRKYWKAFKHKFRLKRTEPVQSSTIHNNTTIPIPIPIPEQQNDVVEVDSNNVEGTDDVAVGGTGNMLVMDLLEERDIEEEEEESEVENSNGCCVCMVRDKGAAFIPCGHVFCTMCCNQIWIL